MMAECPNDVAYVLELSCNVYRRSQKQPTISSTENQRNKLKFIYLLGTEMDKVDGLQVKHSSDDADYNFALLA